MRTEAELQAWLAENAWLQVTDPAEFERQFELFTVGDPTQTPTRLRNPDGSVTTYLRDADGNWVEIPYGADPYAYVAAPPEQRVQMEMLGLAEQTRDSNRGAILGSSANILGGQQAASDQATGVDLWRLGEQQNATTTATALDAQALQQLVGLEQLAYGQDVGTMDALRGSAMLANASDQGALEYLDDSTETAAGQQRALLGDLSGVYQNSQEADAGALSSLGEAADAARAGTRSAIDPLRGMVDGLGDGALSVDWENVDSEAARVSSAGSRYAADQQDAINRMRFNAGLEEVGPAGLVSREAQSVADPAAIAMQRTAADRYLQAALGSGSLTSSAALARPDAESIEAQRGFLRGYQTQSTPGLTAVEQAMFESARRDEEQGRRAAMDAAMRDRQVRGVSGSGDELPALLGAQQTTSQNRMLQDLQALASAQERAERMQAAGTSLAGSMRGDSFDEMYRTGAAADAMALGNRDATMDALSRYSALGGDMRTQSFGEQIQTGRAYDDMQSANRDWTTSALSEAGRYASEARGQDFGERMQAAQEGDSMARFNAAGSIDQANYTAERQRQLADDVWSRQLALTGLDTAASDSNYSRYQDQYDAARDVSGTDFARAGTVYDAATAANADEYNRAGQLVDVNRDVTADSFARVEGVTDQQLDATQQAYLRGATSANTLSDLNATNYARELDYLGSVAGASDAAYNREGDRQASVMDLTSLYTGQGSADAGAVRGALETQLGGIEAATARAELEEDDGLLPSLPLLGPLFSGGLL